MDSAALIGKIIIIALCVNGVLSGVSLALQKIEDATKDPGVGAVLNVVSKIASIGGSLVDFLSANLPH